RETQSKYAEEKSPEKTSHFRTSAAAWLCIRAAAHHQRSGLEQSFRYAGERRENRRASQQGDRRVGAWPARDHECAHWPRTLEERSKGKIFAHAGKQSVPHHQQAGLPRRIFPDDPATACLQMVADK